MQSNRTRARTPILQDYIADDNNSNINNFCNLPDFYKNDMVMQRNNFDDSVNESGTLLTEWLVYLFT